ncbi:La-related protein Larp4B [Geodia barretti]|uniref:La-related protein Larp4B n=1 Tax=Geodia barretti TaxID=519541 RepID=A0AA35SDI3_GEOBA|nr:La-related protein Larp4B [Geodia barretti]
MAETKREEQDSQSSATSTTEQCPDQQPPSNQQQATSHNPVSSAVTMHTKPAGKDLPTSAGTASTRSTPPPPSHLTPPTATHGAAPDIEITDETTGPPKSSEPSSPLSEEDFSSGGEQDDGKGYVAHQFGGPGESPYYMMSLPNGVSSGSGGGDPAMLPGHSLPNTAWGGAGDVGMAEGSYVHMMDSAPFLHHSATSINSHMTSDPMSPPPEGEGLRATLVRQLEYYFSKENLSSDKYLLSQMDGDHYVPVSVIAGFLKVKRLTTDINLIMDAIRESHHLQLDETTEKVRAVPEKRCVLILREIPKDTPQKHIEGLFSSDSCPNFCTCEFAENDCWYITFDSEEDTQKAFAHLREDVRNFLGHPIRARIKGTTVQRPSAVTKKSHYPSSSSSYPSVQNVYNGQQPVQYFSQPVSQWGPYYHGDPNYMPYMNGYHPPQGFGPPLPSSQPQPPTSKPSPVSNGAPPTIQANAGSSSGPQNLPPKPQRSELKVGSARDGVRNAPGNKSQSPYSRSGDREYSRSGDREYRGDREYSRDFSRTNRSQVFNRVEGRPPSTGRCPCVN